MTSAPLREYDVAVVGSGPVAMVAALVFSRTLATVLLTRPTQRACGIESVPAPLLTALIEFGIHPVEIGVRQLFQHRRVAWQTEEPVIRSARAAAHIDRELLDAALSARVAASPHLTVLDSPSGPPRREGGGFVGAGYRARWLVDATGRSSFAKRTLIGPPRGWAATSWTAARDAAAGRVDGELWMAALPDGYAYRLASDDRITIGRVSWEKAARSFDEVVASAKAGGAEWILEGMPPEMMDRRVRPASAAWPGEAPEPDVIRIGDAAMARDAMASQGLAIGISDTFHAADALARAELPRLEARHREARESHLTTLGELLAACRYAHLPAYRSYIDWIERERRRGTSPTDSLVTNEPSCEDREAGHG